MTTTGETGLPSTKALSQLTQDEVGITCDFELPFYGDTALQCADGSTVSAPSRSSCVLQNSSLFAGCMATVADYEACTHALVLDPCNAQQILTTDVQCSELNVCYQDL
jgi:hypothetical protein